MTIKKATHLRDLPSGELGFGKYITDHMLEVDWTVKEGWGKPQIVPMHDFQMHPFNGTFQMCSSGFEGMKAYRDPQNRIRTFRPDANAERMVKTSLELCHPAFDPAELVKCIDSWLRLEERWVPARPCTLYIRPTLCSLSPTIGIEPPTHTRIFVVGTPSGPYFPPHLKSVKLRVETYGARAAPGGTGHIKAAANYCVGIKYVAAAGAAGFQQVIWLNGKNITEAGASNIYFYIYNKQNQKELVTPALDGTILPGVTRRSVLELAKGDPRYIVSERAFPVTELLRLHKEKKAISFPSLFRSLKPSSVAPLLSSPLSLPSSIRTPK